MIVVIGNLVGRLDDAGDVQPAGFVAVLSVSAAKAGSSVQVVAKVADDSAGDAVLLGLAAAGVAHVATLRDASSSTAMFRESEETLGDGDEPAVRVDRDGLTLDAADVGLALRYLSDYRVLVVAHDSNGGVIAEAALAATWAGAHLIVVSAEQGTVDVSVPSAAFVLEAAPDAEGLAAALGKYAAMVDSGKDPDTAFAVLTGATS